MKRILMVGDMTWRDELAQDLREGARAIHVTAGPLSQLPELIQQGNGFSHVLIVSDLQGSLVAPEEVNDAISVINNNLTPDIVFQVIVGTEAQGDVFFEQTRPGRDLPRISPYRLLTVYQNTGERGWRCALPGKLKNRIHQGK